MKKFADFIAWRYLRGHSRMLMSFSNLLSLIGIALGVFSLLVVISVMNGFDSDIRQRIIAFRSDVKVAGKDGRPLDNYRELTRKLQGLPYVKHATPILSAELLIQSEGAIYGAVCSGIDYSSYTASTRLEDKIMLGHPDAQALEDNGIILGFDLAINLNVSLRDQVQLSAPVGTEATPFGLLPRSRKFTVIGIYSSGIPDYDLHYCFIPLSAAQYFTRTENAAEFIEVRTRDADKSWYYRKLIDNELPDEYVVNDWSDYEANLFNAIKLEKVLMILVLSLIILLAGFNMSGNLNRLVTEKKRDIGIMFAFGVKRSIVRRIFLNTSFYIGISGILLGMVFASGFLLAQLKWQFIKIPVSGFPIQELPVDLRTGDFVIIPILAMLITLLSALVPTARSNEVSAIEIIQK